MKTYVVHPSADLSVYFVLIGIVFGGIISWLFLLGSFEVVRILVSRLRYSRNFAGHGEFSFKRLGVFFLAILLALGFYLGLLYLRGWFVILAFGLLGAALSLSITLKNRK